MSIKLMSLVWEVRFPTQSQLLIALKLADFANDVGDNVYPSRNRLADDAQCSESTVKATLRAFREVGLLHVVREGGKGPKDTTEYKLNTRLLVALAEGVCRLEHGEGGLEIKWANKGSEFDPFGDLRGQTEPLRGQPAPDKGSNHSPPIHQEPSLRLISAPERASDASARAPAAKAELLLDGDAPWSAWMAWADEHNCRATFEAEGAVVVFSRFPHAKSPRPKLPPTKGSARWNELFEQRARSLTSRKDQAAGEAA